MKNPTDEELSVARDKAASIQMKAANGDGLSEAELEEFANCRALCTYATLLTNFEAIKDETVGDAERLLLAIGTYFSQAESAQLYADAKKRAAMRTIQDRRIIH